MYTTTIERQSFIVTNSAGRPLYFFSHDAPSNQPPLGHDLLKEYIRDAQDVFRKECDALFDLQHPFSEKDASRLISMLHLLVDARKTWQEEKEAPHPITKVRGQ